MSSVAIDTVNLFTRRQGFDPGKKDHAGMRLQVLTTTQRDALTGEGAAGQGDVIFNSTNNALEMYTGSYWTAANFCTAINHTTGSTRTLTADQSGATIFLNKADGVVITLPAPVVGLSFTFVALTSVTSNSYKVITNAGTVFIKGLLVSVDTDSTNALAYDQVGNGSTHVAITMNGTTTGGLIYTNFQLVCMSSTVWGVVRGTNFGSGSVATPFATS